MNNKYSGRGLVNFYDKFNKKNLERLVNIVKNDDDLVIGIRDEYINIYYKGGNMAKISSERSIQFDHNYFKGDKKAKGKDHKELKKQKAGELLKSKDEDGCYDWETFIGDMKDLMNRYWKWLEDERHKSLKEKDTQHLLCIQNTENSEYTVIDVEFEVSTQAGYKYQKLEKQRKGVDKNKKKPRFDIIAIRNKDHKLCVIELKKGIKALSGKSGLGDHADSFEGSVGGKYYKQFTKEVNNIIQSKKTLHLLSEDFKLVDTETQPEFLYAYSYDGSDKEGQRRDFLSQQKASECENYKVMFLEQGDYTLSDEKRYKQ